MTYNTYTNTSMHCQKLFATPWLPNTYFSQPSPALRDSTNSPASTAITTSIGKTNEKNPQKPKTPNVPVATMQETYSPQQNQNKGSIKPLWTATVFTCSWNGWNSSLCFATCCCVGRKPTKCFA